MSRSSKRSAPGNGKDVTVRYGLSVPNFADPSRRVKLAVASDAAGWDGFFLWDHIVVDRSSPPPIFEPWTTLAAAAVMTTTVRLGTGLVKAVVDVAIVGDDEPVPMAQRDRVRQMEAETDPRRKLAMYGEHLAESSPRRVPIELLVRAAAASDAGAAGVWDQLEAERLRGMGFFARHLEAGGHLRPAVSVEEATDVLWAYNSAALYEMLVMRRGWAPERYGWWVAVALAAALLV